VICIPALLIRKSKVSRSQLSLRELAITAAECVERRRVAGVELQRHRGAAELGDGFDDLVRLVGVRVGGDDQIGAVAGECKRGGASDSSVCARDEGDTGRTWHLAAPSCRE
jgi:hypothetical protein